MDVSFTPNGKWFVFSTSTGKTLEKGFASKPAALAWIAARTKKDAA